MSGKLNPVKTYPLKSLLLLAIVFGSATWAKGKSTSQDIPKKMEDRIENESAIFARVRAMKGEKLKYQMQLLTIGKVQAPIGFSYEKISNFNNLRGVSEVFEDVNWDPDKNLLILNMVAFKFRALMTIKITPQAPTERRKAFSFEVISGTLTGLKGQLSVEDRPVLKSVIRMEGDYHYDEFPIPKFFLETGLEIVLQKISAKVRTYIEQEKQK